VAVKAIDKALAAGDLTDQEAADAKAALDEKTFPGYAGTRLLIHRRFTGFAPPFSAESQERPALCC
jgi:hypothetical protein